MSEKNATLNLHYDMKMYSP